MNNLKRFILSCCFSPFLLNGQNPKVVATASIISNIAEELAPKSFHIKCIVPIGGDPHIYESTPGDARMVAEADLVLKNGLTFEGWLDELIKNSGTKAQIVTVTDSIVPIVSPAYKNATDPHAWMDARNGIVYARNIKNALIDLQPEKRDTIEQLFHRYKLMLEELDSFIVMQIQLIPPERRILITSHDAFQYFGKRYGLQLESILGISTDAEVQTSDIIHLNHVIKSSGVPAVFIESTVNPKVLEQIAKDNGIVIGGKLYSDSIGNRESPAPSYIKMLEYNTNTIVSGLSRQDPENISTTEDPVSKAIVYILLGFLAAGVIIVLIRKLN